MKTVHINQTNRHTQAAPLAVIKATLERQFGGTGAQPSLDEQMSRYAAENKSEDSTSEPTAPGAPLPISPNLGENPNDTPPGPTGAGPADDPGSLPR
jgi:hypothetical protein